MWLIRNHMAVCKILDKSPFSLTLGVISKLIKNNSGNISQISQTAMWFLINHIFIDKHHTITSTMSNQRVDYKTEGHYKTVGWLQNKQLTSPVWLQKEMWLSIEWNPITLEKTCVNGENRSVTKLNKNLAMHREGKNLMFLKLNNYMIKSKYLSNVIWANIIGVLII